MGKSKMGSTGCEPWDQKPSEPKGNEAIRSVNKGSGTGPGKAPKQSGTTDTQRHIRGISGVKGGAHGWRQRKRQSQR